MASTGLRVAGVGLLAQAMFGLSATAMAQGLPSPTIDRPVVVTYDDNGTAILVIVFDARNCANPRSAYIFDNRTKVLIDGAAKAVLCGDRLVMYMAFGPYDQFVARHQAAGLSYGSLNSRVPGPPLRPARTHAYASRAAAAAALSELENRGSGGTSVQRPSGTQAAAAGGAAPGASAATIGGPAILEAISLAWSRVRGARQGASIRTSIVPLLGSDVWHIDREISKVACRKAESGFRCSYFLRSVTTPDAGSFLAKMRYIGLKAEGDDDVSSVQTHSFYKVGGRWTSPSYEASLRQSETSSATGPDPAQVERKRKFDECQYSGPRLIPCVY